MRLPHLVLTVAVLAAAAVAGAAGQADVRWSHHRETGEYAFAIGDFTRAESELRAALEIAQTFPQGDPRLETSLDELARLLENRSRLDEAQPLYQLEVAAREARLGPDDAGLLDPLAGVARTALAAGDSPTAEAALRRYDRIATASGQADPRQHRMVLDLLARQQVLLGHPEEALGFKRRAVALLDADPSLTPSERADALEGLAGLEIGSGDPAKAESLFQDAAKLRAEDGGNAAEVLAGGAKAALAAGQVEAAVRLAEDALARKPDAGTELAVRRTLADAAWQVMPQGDLRPGDLLTGGADSPELSRAAEALAALLALQEARFGPASPEAQATLERIVLVEARRGRAAEAAAAERRLLGMAPPDSDTARRARTDLVGLLAAAGDTAGAAEANAALIAEQEAAWGADDPRLLPALSRQLDLLTQLKHKREARALKKRIRKLERAGDARIPRALQGRSGSRWCRL